MSHTYITYIVQFGINWNIFKKALTVDRNFKP